MANDLVVVDVSHWQTDSQCDWNDFLEAGVVGVILKATEGTGYTDPTFAKRKKSAAAAGLIVSSYHFLKHGSAAAQMDYYLACVKPEPGERVVIDYEDTSCTLKDLEEAINALAGRNVQITVYGANGFLGAQLAGKKNETLAKCALWVASYTSAADPTMTNLKGTWPVWSLWQYTDKANVGGNTPLDGNRFNGSVEACKAWLGPSQGEVGPSPGPEPGPPIAEAPYVTITLQSDVPVNISISVGANVTLVGAVPAS